MNETSATTESGRAMSDRFSRIYLDANILIYAMEKDDEPGILARRWLMQAERGRMAAMTSELSLAEVLSHPIRHGNHCLISGYERLLESRPSLVVLPVDRPVLMKAAAIKARLGSLLPDAIHVATADVSGCEAFLTEDHRLKVPGGLRKVALADIAAYL